MEFMNSAITTSMHHPWLLFVHQVCELQSTLSACREELNAYLQQMEEVKKNSESELQKYNDKVQHYKQWHSWQWLSLQGNLYALLCCKAHFSGWSSPLLLPPQVSSLQEKLHRAGLVCQSSSEQNLQLQLSLQQQQTMLTESAAHISELEESQSQLQAQVS